MGNDLTTLIPAGISEEEWLRLTGAPVEKAGLNLPSLRVNYDDQDDDGNDIPRGQFVISNPDGVRVFAKSVKLRIMAVRMQYSRYDAEAQKTASTSIYFRSFYDEVPDDTGTLKCGKVDKKKFETLTDPEKNFQKSIKLARVLFCLISVEGKTAKGEDATIENMPCVFYARGTNYMPISDYLDQFNKKGSYSSVWTEFTLERKRNGGASFWEVKPETKDKANVTVEDITLLRDFDATIQAVNDDILGKWTKAKAKQGNPDMQAVAQSLSGNTPPWDNDLDDPTDGGLADDFSKPLIAG